MLFLCTKYCASTRCASLGFAKDWALILWGKRLWGNLKIHQNVPFCHYNCAKHAWNHFIKPIQFLTLHATKHERKGLSARLEWDAWYKSKTALCGYWTTPLPLLPPHHWCSFLLRWKVAVACWWEIQLSLRWSQSSDTLVSLFLTWNSNFFLHK